MTRISYLEEFILVANNLSLTKAARQLNLTQPAVSKHMSALERDFGIQLLVRDNQSIALTNAGKELLGYANDIVDTFSLAQSRMRAISHSRQTEIKIGGLYHGRQTRKVILEALGKLDSTTFRFCDVDKNPLDALLEQDIDVLIQTGARELIEDKRVKAIHLFDDDLFVAVPKTSTLAQKDSLTVKDLESVTVLQPTGSNLLALECSPLAESLPLKKYVYAPTVFSFSMIELADSEVLILSREIAEGGFSSDAYLLKPFNDIKMAKYAAVLARRSQGELQRLCQELENATAHIGK